MVRIYTLWLPVWKTWSVYLYMHIYARDRGGPCPACDRQCLRNGYIISLGFFPHIFNHTIPAAYALFHGAYGIGASDVSSIGVAYVKAWHGIYEGVMQCRADAHYLQTIPLLYQLALFIWLNKLILKKCILWVYLSEIIMLPWLHRKQTNTATDRHGNMFNLSYFWRKTMRLQSHKTLK